MLPLLLAMTFLVFAIVNLGPGSPLAQYQENPRMSREDLLRIQENLGLDKPWPERYLLWLGNLLRGNLGYSFINGASVTDIVVTVLPNTLLLTGAATLLALAIAIPLGILAAVRRNSWVDNLVYAVGTALGSVPTFWLGFMFIILFAVQFREWGLPSLPVGGTYDYRSGGGLLDRLRHLLLPSVSLALLSMAGWMMYIRSQMLEVIRQDYIRTARAKGLRERATLYRHGFRNALIPLITLVGLSLPDLFGGAFVIETIFAWNGMGRVAVNAATNNDYTVIMGGFGNVTGAILSAAVLGMVEALTAGYLTSGYADMVVFAVMLVVLLFRPHGVFGKVSRV
jgi:peptide/nickel transport system permease protein